MSLWDIIKIPVKLVDLLILCIMDDALGIKKKHINLIHNVAIIISKANQSQMKLGSTIKGNETFKSPNQCKCII